MTVDQLRQQAQSRADLIAGWRYGRAVTAATTAAPPPVAPPADTPTDDSEETPADDAADEKVSQALKDLGDALAAAEAAQAADPGNGTDDADAKVTADLAALRTAYNQAVSDQQADVDGGEADDAQPAPSSDDGQGDDDTDMAAATEGFAMPATPSPTGEDDAPSTPADQTPANAAPSDDDTFPVDGDENQDLPPGAIEGPAFTIPVGVIEGIETSDGRMIAENGLVWRTPPLPLMAMWENSAWGHEGAKIVGRIDEVFRDGTVIGCRGVFDTSPEGLEAARMVDQQMFRGVSVDVTNATEDITVTGVDDDGFPTEVAELIATGEIAGWTITPFPAFADCYIVLGDGSGDKPAAIPQQSGDETASAINIINMAECEPCQTDAVITASGGPMAPPRSWFEDPELAEVTPLDVSSDGRVFGHLAPFGVCHTGIDGRCVLAPRSSTDYAYFRTGSVLTAEGETVATGPLTVGTGHAALSMSRTATMAHYDDSGTAVADVVVGEDAHGIWVAGAVRPGATEEQIYALRASALSGDWRKVGRGLELVAALAVNTPGFPPVKALAASGVPMAMVAAGVAQIAALRPAEGDTVEMSAMERAMAPLLDVSADRLRDRMAPLR